MLDIKPHDAGSVLPVWAQPSARRNAVTGIHNGMLRVSVSAAPEQGKANKAIAAVLCKALALPKSSIELISGTTSRSKKFLIHGISPDELRGLCEAVLKPPST